MGLSKGKKIFIVGTIAMVILVISTIISWPSQEMITIEGTIVDTQFFPGSFFQNATTILTFEDGRVIQVLGSPDGLVLNKPLRITMSREKGIWRIQKIEPMVG